MRFHIFGVINCSKEGGTTMYRWHFDNCKLKGDNNE